MISFFSVVGPKRVGGPCVMLVAGIDEVGRGCLAGPVIAAAVILDPRNPVEGLADSKLLQAERRKIISDRIKKQAIAWSIGRTEASEIDRINILQASMLAMCRAFSHLAQGPDWVNVDGPYYPALDCKGKAIVNGDKITAEISAASIIAKVYRDAEMVVLDALCPGYEFARHKGYPTRQHLIRLRYNGISAVHRKSFRPVKNVIFNRGRFFRLLD